MNYYKATIQYDGTDYCGFQWQKDLPTIQNEINSSLSKLLVGKITTMGASRTDTGVHAVEQFVKVSCEQLVECETFTARLNEILPSQIECLSFEPCPSNYSPAADHKSKQYRYFFTNKLRTSSSDRRFIVNHPYHLDIALMKECAQAVVGTKDFRNFCSAGSNVKTTIRQITSCAITEVNPHTVLPNSNLFYIPSDLDHCFQLEIEGKGFLKQMVRHLMRALWLVGSGRLSSGDFALLFVGPKSTRRMWMVAPPQGLFLYCIKSHQNS